MHRVALLVPEEYRGYYSDTESAKTDMLRFIE
jgi:hypothetical protein